MSDQIRQLAAIMFSDIVGYTILMGSDEANALDLLRKSRSIQQSLVAKYNGIWLKEMGDGVLAQFSSAYDSVCCAIEIQNRAQRELELQIRIGIHLGDVTVENEDIFGDGVNIASRLQSIADPGGIYISKSIQTAVKAMADIDLEYLGELHLKNVGDPIKTYYIKGPFLPVPSAGKIKELAGAERKRIYVIPKIAAILSVLVAVYWFFIRAPIAESNAIKSIDIIAVLPFSNTKTNPETDYLGFAIADQIIGSLAYLKNIAVRPSGSIRKYEKQTIDPIAVGEDLKVDYVLIGNYLMEANIIRLNVEFIRVSNNEMIWREPIEVDFHNVFDLQDFVAKKVVESINTQFSQQELSKINNDIPTNPLAYEYYLRGLAFPLTTESNQIAVEMLKKSIELDSNFAPAYSQLADRLHRVATFGKFDSEKSEQIENLYLKAISLNNDLISAHAGLAMRYVEMGRMDEAIEISNHILEINPNNANALFSLGYIYRYAGMDHESILTMKKAFLIDPRNPKFRSMSLSYYNIGEYEKALILFESIEGSGWVHGMKGFLFFKLGKNEQALEMFNQIINNDPDSFWGLISTTYKAIIQGDTLTAIQTLQKQELRNIVDSEAIYYRACDYALIGEKKRCFQTLQKAVDGGYFNYPLMLRETDFDSMRHNPEFQEILKEAKLKHEALKKRFF